jgi:hypothetical protein
VAIALRSMLGGRYDRADAARVASRVISVVKAP